MTDPISQQLDAAVAQMVAAVNAAKAQIADLEGPLWGFDASNDAQFQNGVNVFGYPDVVRYYHHPGERILPPTEFDRMGFQYVISGKATPAEVTAGKADEDMTTLAKWMQPGDVYCPWHEPEDDIEKDNFSLVDYHNMCDHVSTIFRAANPHVQLACIEMGFTFTGGKGRNWKNYIPQDFDVLGVDVYALGSIGVSLQNIPSMFSHAEDAANSLGKEFNIMETGVGQKVNGPARVAAINSVANAAKKSSAKRICYFSADQNGEWALKTAAEQNAWASAR